MSFLRIGSLVSFGYSDWFFRIGYRFISSDWFGYFIGLVQVDFIGLDSAYSWDWIGLFRRIGCIKSK
jgi:hypothetical protein